MVSKVNHPQMALIQVSEILKYCIYVVLNSYDLFIIPSTLVTYPSVAALYYGALQLGLTYLFLWRQYVRCHLWLRPYTWIFIKETTVIPLIAINHKHHYHHKPFPWRIHGAGIFTYMTGSFMGHMLVNIPAPWILWDWYPLVYKKLWNDPPLLKGQATNQMGNVQ